MSLVKDSPYHVIVMGMCNSGKSSIITRYCDGDFGCFPCTIEDSYRKKTVIVDGDEVNLEIIDTPGQEEYYVLTEYDILKGDCFVVVYSF